MDMINMDSNNRINRILRECIYNSSYETAAIKMAPALKIMID